MLRTYEDLEQKVKHQTVKKRIAVAAAGDLHTLEGIDEAVSKGMIEPVLIGDEKKIRQIISQRCVHLDRVQVIDEPDNINAARRAVDLACRGEADILMKGKLQTAELMGQAVNSQRGLKTHQIMTHAGLYQVPGYSKLALLTDGGLIPCPDAEQKKKIIENAVKLLKKLGCEMPKVAALCGAEVENPKIRASADAAQLKRWNQEGILTGCLVEGPISFDLMFSKESAQMKGYESPVSGEADIWLCPDMTAGNLMGKAMMYTAGAKMAGLITGAKVPIVLVSRGASAEEKYASIVFAAAVAD